MVGKRSSLLGYSTWTGVVPNGKDAIDRIVGMCNLSPAILASTFDRRAFLKSTHGWKKNPGRTATFRATSSSALRWYPRRLLSAWKSLLPRGMRDRIAEKFPHGRKDMDPRPWITNLSVPRNHGPPPLEFRYAIRYRKWCHRGVGIRQLFAME
jgi:hypothetical protein